MKQHRDFVVLVKNGVEINALVAISHPVTTPATQTEEAVTVEHLTLSYLDPSGQSPLPSGDQLRNSQKIEFDVPPLKEGRTSGWKDVTALTVAQVEVPEAAGSGSERWGGSDWTTQPGQGMTYPSEGFAGATPSSPVVEGAEVKQGEVGPDGKTDKERGAAWGSNEHIRSIGGGKDGVNDPEFVQTDPELMKAFNDGRAGKDGEESSYVDTLADNADHAKNTPFPSGDGRMLSGHGANPPEGDADPSAVDNPAPASPKDPAFDEGSTVGE